MERYYLIRNRLIQNSMNDVILEKAISIVYTILYNEFFRHSVHRDEFKVHAAIVDGGIKFSVIIPSIEAEEITKSTDKVIRKAYREAIIGKSGIIKSSRTMSAKSSLKSLNSDKPGRIRNVLVTSKDRYVKRKADKLIRSGDKGSYGVASGVGSFLTSEQFMNSYANQIDKFMDRNSDKIWEQIKIPISKVIQDAKISDRE